MAINGLVDRLYRFHQRKAHSRSRQFAQANGCYQVWLIISAGFAKGGAIHLRMADSFCLLGARLVG
jgi:hypothetical protein